MHEDPSATPISPRPSSARKALAFVPYVDALTTDKNMLNLCKQEIVAGELAQFPCKIFAKKNYKDFEAWLDALLAVSDD